jgi:GT2 family glycosyltransferase
MEKIETVILLLSHNGMEIQYDNKPLLPQCLDNLIKTEGNYKVICISNGSTDGSENYLKEHYKNIEIMHNENNDTMSIVYNKAIRYALEKYKPEYITIMSNDVFVKDPAWLENLVKTFDDYKSAGIVGCKLLYPDGKIQNGGIKKGAWMHNKGKGKEDSGEYDYVDKVEAVHMACMLIKTDIFDKVGLFDEHFRFAFDDYDYCLRAQEKGYDVIYNGKVALYHLDGITLNNDAKDQYDRGKEIDKFGVDQREFIYFARKHFKGVKRVVGLTWVVFGRSIFTTSRHGVIGLGNFKLNDKILKRIKISTDVLMDHSDR